MTNGLFLALIFVIAIFAYFHLRLTLAGALQIEKGLHDLTEQVRVLSENASVIASEMEHVRKHRGGS